MLRVNLKVRRGPKQFIELKCKERSLEEGHQPAIIAGLG
jgi:hypothetical protein